MSTSTFSSFWPVSRAMTWAMRSRALMISRAMIAMSVAWPPAPPLGWWIRKRVCGRQKRRSLGTDRNRCVAALPTQPVPIMRTGAEMKRMTSCTVSPDSRWPPGEDTSMSMGSVGESASSAMRRRTVSAADWSLMAPNTSTVRDLNAFSSRNELRGSAEEAGGGGVSMCI